MKCPLIGIANPAEWRRESPTEADCLQEECAWWDHKYRVCGEKVIKKTLDSIAHSLADIEAKMPTEVSFRR